ncbi:MAG: hypothetical protein M0Z99_28010 [Betaproteobacteria bacterium]|nr:hypothetical protein [Betaproteobacteria bacterium]
MASALKAGTAGSTFLPAIRFLAQMPTLGSADAEAREEDHDIKAVLLQI